MKTILISICLLIPWGAWGGYDDSPWALYRVEMDLADRLQKQVLDHVLGPGQSAVFVAMDVELSSQEESSSRDGVGVVKKRTQRASQTKASRESKLAVRRTAKRLSVRVLYNGKAAGPEVEAAQDARKAVLELQGKDVDIKFIAVPVWK